MKKEITPIYFSLMFIFPPHTLFCPHQFMGDTFNYIYNQIQLNFSLNEYSWSNLEYWKNQQKPNGSEIFRGKAKKMPLRMAILINLMKAMDEKLSHKSIAFEIQCKIRLFYSFFRSIHTTKSACLRTIKSSLYVYGDSTLNLKSIDNFTSFSTHTQDIFYFLQELRQIRKWWFS